jgi:hypothetical protein
MIGDAQDFSALPSKYVFHLFQVDEQVVWKKEQHYSELKNITYFGYNHILGLGLLIDYDEGPSDKSSPPIEKLYIFEFDPTANSIVPIFNQGF